MYLFIQLPGDNNRFLLTLAILSPAFGQAAQMTELAFELPYKLIVTFFAFGSVDIWVRD